MDTVSFPVSKKKIRLKVVTGTFLRRAREKQNILVQVIIRRNSPLRKNFLKLQNSY